MLCLSSNKLAQTMPRVPVFSKFNLANCEGLLGTNKLIFRLTFSRVIVPDPEAANGGAEQERNNSRPRKPRRADPAHQRQLTSGDTPPMA